MKARLLARIMAGRSPLEEALGPELDLACLFASPKPEEPQPRLGMTTAQIQRQNDLVFRRFVAGLLVVGAMIILAMIFRWHL